MYKLEGVVKEGEHPQHRHSTGVIEIWKGRYNGKVVALKVLRVPPGDPQIRGIKSVSMSHGPSQVGLFDFVLTDGVAVLQGSGVDDTAQARKYSPFLRGIDDRVRLLPGIPLVQEREYHGLSEGEPRHRSVRSGQCIQANHTLPTLTRTYEQLSNVASGLLFVHTSRLVHGALRPVCWVLLSLTIF